MAKTVTTNQRLKEQARVLRGHIMPNSDFFKTFKLAAEQKWHTISIQQDLWGFQLQRGTRWNPGLSDEEINEYEAAVDTQFPFDFRAFLRQMNGTDIPSVDVRGGSGESHNLGPGFYTYPRDIRLIQEKIEIVSRDRDQLTATLSAEGFLLSDDAKLIPIYGHRYVVCGPNLTDTTVLSIWDSSDAIVYGKTLKEYLEREVFEDGNN